MTNRAVDRWFNNLGKRPVLAVTLSILWLILIVWVGYGWNLGSIGLIDETEPLFAEASRQMFVTGDWITPFFNGETRFDKPALIYWCQAIAYAIIGVNEFAVRLPSAIAALAVISLSYYTLLMYLARLDELEHISRPTRRWLTAALGAVIMALTPEMIVWGRTGVSDMLLTGCVATALLCFFLGYAKEGMGNGQWAMGNGQWGRDTEVNSSQSLIANRQSLLPNKWYLAFYVLIAGAILTKGPVGIVLPGLIIAAFLLYVGSLPEVLREMRLLMGMLIVFGLSVPWYVLVIWRNGWNYINSFFGYHNLERFTEVVNGHRAPWYFYFVVVLLGFAPYSIYLPVAIARLKFWQIKYWRSQERSQQLGLFAFVWFIVIFGFFTVAVTKLPSYVLPLMPAAAILVTLFWSDFFLDKGIVGVGGQGVISSASPAPPAPPASPLPLWSGWVNVAFLSAVGVALFHLPQLLGKDPAAPNFPQQLQQLNLPMLGGVIWLLSAVIIAVLLLRRVWLPIIVVNLLGFTAFLIVVLTPALFLVDHERQLPLRELSAIAVQAKQPNEELIMVGFKKPTVVFYTQQNVTFFKFTEQAQKHIQKQAANKAQPDSVLVLSQPKKLIQMGLQPADYENLGTSGAYQLIRVGLKN
ncbi:glycosyltransferase family 39 protein [Scytonema hofmannii FACHB-248]|uniref:Glycosyltransferase family 39 protein n=1 Tax=Scytonema hofmannii FACHB-248 TaxID=1842502 RepID=A0ABR8GQB5_9CYAN|nr:MULTISPECIES: glycosyltransferase family 39 protein [Nostocales]MBD2605229.1 glycosyltransferase family 39 protein [Scytonema hofmannii FACHB-248]